MTGPRVCFFDIDGTLIRSGGAGRAAMEAALEELFGVTEVGRDVPFSGRTDRAILADLLTAAGQSAEPDRLARFLEAYLRHLPRTLEQRRGEVLPGIFDLLDRLHAARLHVGLLTGNVYHGARIKLGHYGLIERFAFGGFGDRHSDRSDVAREALAAAERHLGQELDGGSVWVIGDSPLDVQCARAIGARALAVATGWHAREELAAAGPDVLLEDLSHTDNVAGLMMA